MAKAARYLFDRNFEVAEPPEVAVERRLRDEFEKTLSDAKADAYERGRAEGARDAMESIEARTENAAGAVVDTARSILGRLDAECGEIRAEAAQIALAAAERLAGDLVQREPVSLLESLFSDCLEQLADAPHIAVTVHDSLAGGLQDRLAAIAGQRGFSGQIVVLGDPETTAGDCRIEWADGGVSRDLEKLRHGVGDIVERHLTRQKPATATAAVNGSAAVEIDDAPAAAAPPPGGESTDAADTHMRTNGSGEGP